MEYELVDVDLVIFFFFFKQKTAYEMRISDWSSDVCSSDLIVESCNEISRGNHQALQAGRGARSPGRYRRERPDRYRSQRLRPPKGPYRAVPGRRVCGRFPAQDTGRGTRKSVA